MCLQLGVTAVPAQVTALVHEKAQGNPLFIEELTACAAGGSANRRLRRRNAG